MRRNQIISLTLGRSQLNIQVHCFQVLFSTQLKATIQSSFPPLYNKDFSFSFNNLILISLWAFASSALNIYVSANFLFTTIYLLSKKIYSSYHPFLTFFWILTCNIFNIHISTNSLCKATEADARQEGRRYAVALKEGVVGAQPRKAGSSGSWKCKEMDSPLKPPEGMRACWHFDFSPVRLISRVWLP